MDKFRDAIPCLGEKFDTAKLIREKEASTSNKWTSGNPAPHLELTVLPSQSEAFFHPHMMTHENLHEFETSMELLLNVKLAMTVKKKIDASIDAHFPGNGKVIVHLWFSPPEYLQEVLAMPNKQAYILDALLNPLTPKHAKTLAETAEKANLKGWAGSFTFGLKALQARARELGVSEEDLEAADKTPPRDDKRAAVRDLCIEQTKGAGGDGAAVAHRVAALREELEPLLADPSPMQPAPHEGLPKLLVRDLVKEKNNPSLKWADELDFSEIGMDRIARWYPAFFLNSMLGALLMRLTISHQSDVGVQMAMYMTNAALQLLLNILVWTQTQFIADAMNWVTTCGQGPPLDIEAKRRLLTDDSKIRAILFECKQFSEGWAICAVFAANCIYAFSMNCPLVDGYKRQDDYIGATNLLNLINASSAFVGNIVTSADGTNSTTFTPLKLRDGLYQDPTTWSEGNMLFMCLFQLAIELPVDILSTRALELLRQPVFSALRPHLGNVRVMYAFQVFLSLAMMSVIINFKHEIVFGKLLHDVNCNDPRVVADCRGSQEVRAAAGLSTSVADKLTRMGWADPLDVCCFHTQPCYGDDEGCDTGSVYNNILHECNETDPLKVGSCWIDSKDSSLINDRLGAMNGAGGENDVLLRLFHLLEALAFGWIVVIFGIMFIPSNINTADEDIVEFNGKIRKAVDAGKATRLADDFLTALGLDDFIYPLLHEFGIEHVTDMWQVDRAELEAEREKKDHRLGALLKKEEDTGGGEVKLSELVMRDRAKGVTAEDIKCFLAKFSELPVSNAKDSDVVHIKDERAVKDCLNDIRKSEVIIGDRIIPEQFDSWADKLRSRSGQREGLYADAVEKLRVQSKRKVRTYVIEVATSVRGAVVDDRALQVHVEFFGEHTERISKDPSVLIPKGASPDPMAFLPTHANRFQSIGKASGTDGPYVASGRIYTRSSGDLELGQYHQIQLSSWHLGTRELIDKTPFKPGSTAAFEVRIPDLGDVTACRVWLTNSGVPLSWYCESISITCTQTMHKRAFQGAHHPCKGEVYTQKITGKMLMVQKPTEDDLAHSDSPVRRTLSVMVPEAELVKTLSDLEQHPKERHGGEEEGEEGGVEMTLDDGLTQTLSVRSQSARLGLLVDDLSMPSDSPQRNADDRSPSPSRQDRQDGMWTHLLATGGEGDALPKEDLIEMCKIHSQDVLRSGGEELLTVVEIEEVLETCLNNDVGNIVILQFTDAVSKAMVAKGCKQDEITKYFGTKRYVEVKDLPPWHTESTLHREAKFRYTVTLETSNHHRASFQGRVYVQLLGVVDGQDGELPTVRFYAHLAHFHHSFTTHVRSNVAQVVAGRFLPMVENTIWFSSEEAQGQEKYKEKAPKVHLHKGETLTFDYPTMVPLGELTCCRIWHDHKKDGWHLHEVVVQLKDGGEAPWCALGPFLGTSRSLFGDLTLRCSVGGSLVMTGLRMRRGRCLSSSGCH